MFQSIYLFIAQNLTFILAGIAAFIVLGAACYFGYQYFASSLSSDKSAATIDLNSIGAAQETTSNVRNSSTAVQTPQIVVLAGNPENHNQNKDLGLIPGGSVHTREEPNSLTGQALDEMEMEEKSDTASTHNDNKSLSDSTVDTEIEENSQTDEVPHGQNTVYETAQLDVLTVGSNYEIEKTYLLNRFFSDYQYRVKLKLGNTEQKIFNVYLKVEKTTVTITQAQHMILEAVKLIDSQASIIKLFDGEITRFEAAYNQDKTAEIKIHSDERHNQGIFQNPLMVFRSQFSATDQYPVCNFKLKIVSN